MGEGIAVPQIRVSDGPNDFSPTLDSPLEQWGAATGRPRSSESEGMSGFHFAFWDDEEGIMQGTAESGRESGRVKRTRCGKDAGGIVIYN